MARPKEGKDKEFYLGRIRELESQVKALKKRLKRYERREHFYDNKDLEDEPSNTIDPLPPRIPCEECNKGFMIEINILDRIFRRCETCGFRSRAKKVPSNEEKS